MGLCRRDCERHGDLHIHWNYSLLQLRENAPSYYKPSQWIIIQSGLFPPHTMTPSRNHPISSVAGVGWAWETRSCKVELLRYSRVARLYHVIQDSFLVQQSTGLVQSPHSVLMVSCSCIRTWRVWGIVWWLAGCAKLVRGKSWKAVGVVFGEQSQVTKMEDDYV